MLYIYCPYCKESREEHEFHYADEAFIERPEDPQILSDKEWSDYLFNRSNIEGEQYEQWVHLSCRKFFILKRNTKDNDISEVSTMENSQKIKQK